MVHQESLRVSNRISNRMPQPFSIARVGRISVRLLLILICSTGSGTAYIDGQEADAPISFAQFTNYQLSGAAMDAWKKWEALLETGDPGIVITDPADGQVILERCPTRSSVVMLRIDLSWGALPQELESSVPDFAGNATVALDGKNVQHFPLFRRCSPLADSSELPNSCQRADRPVFFNVLQREVILRDVRCQSLHTITVEAQLLEVQGQAAESIGASFGSSHVWAQASFLLASAEALPRPKVSSSFPLRSHPPELHFETRSEVCSSDLLQGARLRSEYPGFKQDYMVVHCLLRRFAMERRRNRGGLVMEIGTNDGGGLLVMDFALRPNRTSMLYGGGRGGGGGESSAGVEGVTEVVEEPREEEEEESDRRQEEAGWRLLTLDLPVCPSEEDDPASRLVCVKLDWEGRRSMVGKRAREAGVEFEQLWGDSSTFDFSSLGPIEVWWIDGAHDYEHALQDTAAAAASKAELIMLHDADIPAVMSGARDALSPRRMEKGDAWDEEEGYYTLHRVFDTRILYARRIAP